VKVYFDEMWGNRTRIDYGSGMELNWLCWMYVLSHLTHVNPLLTNLIILSRRLCLKKQNLLQTSHYQAIVTKVFWRYIQVMRYLQSTYWLEPAGSHGVWGLDDYHFLPFFWGSGQLKGHKYIKPRAIHDPEVVEEYSKDYMYFACIQFINSVSHRPQNFCYSCY
jgi:serine/threonine-protein phosphatase 2A activator